MTVFRIWAVQFILWLRYSWPFARDVLWPVLSDGKLQLDEVVGALVRTWPKDPDGGARVLRLPWARFFEPRVGKL